MKLINHHCPICGLKYQTIDDLPDQPTGVCFVCESLKREPLTEHFVEAREQRGQGE